MKKGGSSYQLLVSALVTMIPKGVSLFPTPWCVCVCHQFINSVSFSMCIYVCVTLEEGLADFRLQSTFGFENVSHPVDREKSSKTPR